MKNTRANPKSFTGAKMHGARDSDEVGAPGDRDLLSDTIYSIDYLENIISDDFDTKNMMCVYDMLKSRYSGTKGLKKLFTKNDAELRELMDVCAWTDGVTIIQIRKFCEKYGIVFRCLDINFDMINEHHPTEKDRKRYNAKPLVMVYLENHCYIVDDEKVAKNILTNTNKSRQGSYCSKVVFAINKIKEQTKQKWNESNIVINPEYEDIEGMKDTIVIFDESKFDGEYIRCTEAYFYWCLERGKLRRNTRWTQMKCFKIFLHAERDVMITDFNNFEVTREMYKKTNIDFCGDDVTQLGKILFSNYDANTKTTREPIPVKVKESIYKKYMGRCAICGDDDNIHIDHIKPVCQGGENKADNLQLLCSKCNLNKGGSYCEFNNLMSQFNQETKFLFSEDPENKHAPCATNLNDWENTNINQCVSFDVRKCYTAALTSANTGRWCVLESTDEIQECTELGEDGFYKIIIGGGDEMLKLLFRDAWYKLETVQFIMKFANVTVTHKLISRKTVDPDTFNGFVEYTYNVLGKDAKMPVNAFIGNLGKKVVHCNNIHEIGSKNECMGYAYKHKEFNKMKIVQIGKKDLYHLFVEQDTVMLENARPIRQQVLENAAMMLYKHYRESKMIFKNITMMRTDAFFISGDVSRVHKYCKRIRDQEFGGLAMEAKGNPRYFSGKVASCEDNIVREKRDWAEKVITEAPDEKLADEIIKMNKSACILGMAGTGKSYFVQKYMCDALDRDGLRYHKIAFTNQAARNIGGETFHRFVNIDNMNKINITRNKAKKNYLRGLDYVIVDEISMVKYTLWQVLKGLREEFPNIKLILLGDFDQIPPIENDTRDYENSTMLKELSDWNKYIFTRNMRSDDKVFKLQLDILNENKIDFERFGRKRCNVNLCFTNRMRKLVNSTCMTRFEYEGDVLEYSEHSINVNTYHQEDFRVGAGMPVMAIHTNKKLGFCNGERFEVAFIGFGLVDLGDIQIKADDFFTNFVPAFCITCHKAQGATFDVDYCIFERELFSKNMLYVAVSRTTDINKIHFY